MSALSLTSLGATAHFIPAFIAAPLACDDDAQLTALVRATSKARGQLHAGPRQGLHGSNDYDCFSDVRPDTSSIVNFHFFKKKKILFSFILFESRERKIDRNSQREKEIYHLLVHPSKARSS